MYDGPYRYRRAEIGKNVTPDVSLWGDVKEILTKILEALPEERHPGVGE